MKKILLIVILLHSFAYGGDLFDNLDSMVTTVKMNCGYQRDADNIDDSIIVTYIREGFMLMSLAVKANQIRDTVLTAQGQIDYDLDSVLTVEKVYIKKEDSLFPLEKIDIEKAGGIFKIGKKKTLKTKGHPGFYDWTYGRITLYPVPWRVDTVIIDAVGKVTDIMGTGFATDFPSVYRSLPVIYATYRTLKYKNEYVKAAEWKWDLMFAAQILNLSVNIGINDEPSQ